MNQEIRKCAEKVAAWHVENEPAIQEIWLFPSDKEIRLVDLDPYSLPSEMITPFYHAPDQQIPYPTGIALIRPEEKGRLSPPADWGGWDQAIKIWPRQ